MSSDVLDFLVTCFEWCYGIITFIILAEIPIRLYVRICSGKGEFFR